MNIEKIHERLLGHFGEGVILALTPAEEMIRDPFITVDAGRIDKVCLFCRVESDLAFDFCQSITGMDTGDTLTCVYHLFSYPKKQTLVLKTQVPKGAARLPSCGAVWPATDWYEREVYDLFGVHFDGHPDLRRLLLPDDWEGHPMLKDYQESPSYSATAGPDANPLEMTIPTTRPNPLDLLDTEGILSMNELIFSYDTGEEMVLNMGPHHPSTHGVLRFLIKTDGEIMREATPVVGYLHRAIEKIAEGISYESLYPYVDRIDYVSAMTATHTWALAVEKLIGHEVPERAEYLRVIASELNRISSHAICVGVMAMDIGAITPFPYLLRPRETINDLLEELCGNRLTYNYHRTGGVSHDAPAGWADKTLRFLDQFDRMLPEFDRLITENEIFIDRTGNICAITPEEAVAHGLVGPNLRASGVDFDVRRDVPYSIYDRFDWDVAVGTGSRGTLGDCWDRFWLRCEEMKQSALIARQALEQLPEGPVYNKPKRIRPKGEAWARVESARGDMFCYVVGNGTPQPERVHFRTGSYNAMQIVKLKSQGVMVADLVALIASLDVIAPEIDR